MSDRVALAGGAGGPLGRPVAVKLAAAGFTVAGADRNAGGLSRPRAVAGDGGTPVSGAVLPAYGF